MSESRGKMEWDQTSFVASILINSNLDPKKHKPVNPDDINPYRQNAKGEESPITVGIDVLKILVPTPHAKKPKSCSR